MSSESDRQTTYRSLLAEVRDEIASKSCEADRVRAELAHLQDQERQLAALCGERAPSAPGRSSGDDPGISLPGDQTPERKAGVNFSLEVRRVARAAIATAGRPMNRREILQAVRDANIRLPAAQPEKKVSKILWGDKQLKNERGVGYSLID